MGFLHQDHLAHIPPCDHIVEGSYRINILAVPPAHGFLQYMEELRARMKFRHGLRLLFYRHLDHEPAVIQMK